MGLIDTYRGPEYEIPGCQSMMLNQAYQGQF